MKDRDVVIVEGMRTAFGKIGGSLKEFTPEALGGIGIKGLVEKTRILEKGHVDSVLLGAAMGSSRALNPARWALLDAGLPETTTASYIEMQCGSSIDAINHAAWKIQLNYADVVIAGGMEGYSQVPAKFSQCTPPYRNIPPQYLAPQLTPDFESKQVYGPADMGLTAENLQEKYNISRESQDRFAFRSQTLAKASIEAGYFKDEIIPVMVPQGKKQPPLVFEVDEHPRLSPMETLTKLKPVFKAGGTVTAGNASGLNDGSAFVLMMTRQKAEELGYVPMARWVSCGEAGVDPAIMGISPAFAIPKALDRAGIALSDLDVIECNEAFAVQNLAVIAELENQTGQKVMMEKWNPNGGAIAFGHPNGASGARICMFAMRHLIRTGGRYGVFTSCCGGGLGTAAVIENLRL